MNRRAPERIGITLRPLYRCGKDRRDLSAHSWFLPLAIAVLEHFSRGVVSVGERHPRHGDALLCEWSTIIREQHVEKRLRVVQNDGEIAIATGEVSVLR